MHTSKRIGIGVAILVVLQALVWFGYHALESQRAAPGLSDAFEYEPKGNRAPGLHVVLEKSDGSPFRFRDHQQKPVLLHFWATWCEPCRRELPVLLELSQSSGADNGTFVLVSVDENWAAIRHFFVNQVPASVVRDGTRELRKAYQVTTLPDTFVLRSGTVTARIHGARNWGSDAARDALAELLGP